MVWFEILSELFVNIAAAWFVVVFIDPQVGSTPTSRDILWLLFKFLSGSISLFAAKYLREKSRRKK